MQSSFVLLPERLACFTLAPSAPDNGRLQSSVNIQSSSIGHLRALLLRLCNHNFLNASYRIFIYCIIIHHSSTFFKGFFHILSFLCRPSETCLKAGRASCIFSFFADKMEKAPDPTESGRSGTLIFALASSHSEGTKDAVKKGSCAFVRLISHISG